MRVGWLLEAEMFPDYSDNLIAEVKRQGHDIKVLPALPMGWHWDEVRDQPSKLWPKDACVVFHGSMEIAGQLEHAPWRPGLYANWHNLECTTYYCHLADVLLNADYVMMPLGELVRRQSFLFDLCGKEGAVFVRPNSPRKTFTGSLAHAETFAKDVEFFAFYDVPPETLVLVSSPKRIRCEWRFVVADRQVISGCQYKVDGKLNKAPAVEPAAQRLAEQIASRPFQPDRVWTMDVCEASDGEIRLLEIGSFSCAELYACDVSKIVGEVSHVAAEDWAKSS